MGDWIIRIITFLFVTIVLGHLDDVLELLGYGYLVHWLGPWWSLPIYITIAVFINYVVIKGYDKLKKDILFLERLKDHATRLKEKSVAAARVLSLFEGLFYIILSCYEPIWAVIYFRKSRLYDGFKKADKINLWICTIIGCVVWTILWVYFGIELLDPFFEWIDTTVRKII